VASEGLGADLDFLVSIKLFVEKLWASERGAVYDLREEAYQYLQKCGYSEAEATELLSTFIPRARSSLKRKIEKMKAQGKTPYFELNASEDKLIGCNIRDPNLVLRDALLKVLIKIDWRTFQRNFCKDFLQLLGFEKVKAGRASSDGGLDFYAILRTPLGKYNFLIGEVRLFGQAKHSKKERKVDEDAIIKFARNFEDFSNRRGRAFKYAPSWFKEKRLGLMPLIVTNSRFTGNALDYARDYGIKTLDGEQLTEALVKAALREDIERLLEKYT